MQTGMFVGLTEIKCVCPALKISCDCIVCLSYDSSKMLRKHIFVLLLEHFHSLKMSFFQVL